VYQGLGFTLEDHGFLWCVTIEHDTKNNSLKAKLETLNYKL